MSVWIPSLRRAPARGPGQKRARRDQHCVRAARADGCRLAASTSVCGSREPAADGRSRARGALKQARDVAGALSGHEEHRGPTSGSPSSGGAPGSLTRSRMPAVSLEVTPGSSFADVRLSTHSAPTPPQSRASSPPVRSHRPPSRSRRQVADEAHGVRVLSGSFSPAVSLWRCRSATTGRSRPSPVPLSGLGRLWLSLRPRRGLPGEPGGVRSPDPGGESDPRPDRDRASRDAGPSGASRHRRAGRCLRPLPARHPG